MAITWAIAYAQSRTAAAADEIARRHPGVEILVNNLAIFEPKSFEEIPDADWVMAMRSEPPPV